MVNLRQPAKVLHQRFWSAHTALESFFTFSLDFFVYVYEIMCQHNVNIVYTAVLKIVVFFLHTLIFLFIYFD